MKRYDLRHLNDNFYDRMVEVMNREIGVGEVAIFLFEVGDFTSIQKSADTIKALGDELMNSLKFNEVDWTIVVKKADQSTRQTRIEALTASESSEENEAE